MILVFENLKKLQVVLQGSWIPADILEEPIRYGFDGDSILIEPSVSMSSELRAKLREFGIKGSRKTSICTRKASCWAEILPPQKSGDFPVECTALFYMGKKEFFPFVEELIRLGHLNQQYVFLTDEEGNDKVLCRIVNPPYYFILGTRKNESIRTFLSSQNSGIWVEAGYRHPIQDQIRPQQNMILISADGRWTPLPTLEWKDVLSFVQFTVGADSNLSKGEEPAPFEIPVTLIKGTSTKPEVFWVVRENPFEQIESFVRNIPDELVSQFSYSVAYRDDEPIVILKARNQKAPPTVPLNAERYIPMSQVPWLYIPQGTLMNPPLRPNTLTEIFGQPNEVVWLAPQSTKDRRVSFCVEHIPDNFLPLSQWVHYVVSKHEKPLQRWIDSTIFDVEPFVAMDCEWHQMKRSQKIDDDPETANKVRTSKLPKPKRTRAPKNVEAPVETSKVQIQVPVVEPSEAQIRLDQLTKEFCESDLSWDDPQRISAWVEIGNLYASIEMHPTQASLCWGRALWIAEGDDRNHLIDSWFQYLLADSNEDPFVAIELILQNKNPSFSEILTICAWILKNEKENTKVPNLEELQDFIGKFHPMLDHRMYWMVSVALSRLAQGDKLLLATAYDNVISNNVSVSLREIPTFIRTFNAQSGSSYDLELIRDQLEKYLNTFLNTERRMTEVEARTVKLRPKEHVDAHVKLLFSWALAKIGQHHSSQELLTESLTALKTCYDPHQRVIYPLLCAAFEEQIQGVSQGKGTRELSLDLESKIQSMQPYDAFQWNYIITMYSAVFDFRRASSDPHLFWSLQTKDFDFSPAIFGESSEKRIQNLIDFIHAENTNTKRRVTKDNQRALLYNFMIYLANYVETYKLPSILQNILKSLRESELSFDYISVNFLKIAMKNDLRDIVQELLQEVISISENKPDRKKIQNKMSPIMHFVDFIPPLVQMGLKDQVSILVENWRTFASNININEGKNDEQRFTLQSAAEIFMAGYEIGRRALGDDNVQELLARNESIYQLIQANNRSNQNCRHLIQTMRNIAVHTQSKDESFKVVNRMMDLLPTSSDTYMTNRVTTLSTLYLMNKVVESLVNDSILLSSGTVEWVQTDERLLFHKIQKDLVA